MEPVHPRAHSRLGKTVIAPRKAWERRQGCNDYTLKPFDGTLWVANPIR